ncbi:hypothetical protein U1707_10280 [Sphingomonas sp. PB2P12]|uniref:hypothetical protein n=1 Tax=Sphingomonas sandaracina TaxID=3096157 RepID=UPI002FCAFDFB
MADTVRVSNMPDSGSPAAVAWEMAKYLRNYLPETTDPEAKIKAYLDLYADCHYAARGNRNGIR